MFSIHLFYNFYFHKLKFENNQNIYILSMQFLIQFCKILKILLVFCLDPPAFLHPIYVQKF